MSTTPNDPNSGGYGGYGGAPPYGPAPAAGSGSNPMAIVALVLGILSIPLSCFYGFGIILGIVAIVLGVIAGRKAKAGQAGQGGLARAGLITGIVGVVVGVVVLVLVAVGFSFLNSTDCNDPNLSQQEVQTCLQEELTG